MKFWFIIIDVMCVCESAWKLEMSKTTNDSRIGNQSVREKPNLGILIVLENAFITKRWLCFVKYIQIGWCKMKRESKRWVMHDPNKPWPYERNLALNANSCCGLLNFPLKSLCIIQIRKSTIECVCILAEWETYGPISWISTIHTWYSKRLFSIGIHYFCNSLLRSVFFSFSISW